MLAISGAESGVIQLDSLLGTAGATAGEKSEAGVTCFACALADRGLAALFDSRSRQPHPHSLLVPRHSRFGAGINPLVTSLN